MKIAIISDSHDNLVNIRKAVVIIKKMNIDRVIHCGDFVAPFTFEEYKGLNITGVFGNNDGDRYRMLKRAQLFGVEMAGDIYEFTVDKQKCVVYHGTEQSIVEALAKSQSYDYVFYGHTHSVDDRIVGKTRVVNPGTVHGFGKDATFAVFDTKTKKIEIIHIK